MVDHGHGNILNTNSIYIWYFFRPEYEDGTQHIKNTQIHNVFDGFSYHKISLNFIHRLIKWLDIQDTTDCVVELSSRTTKYLWSNIVLHVLLFVAFFRRILVPAHEFRYKLCKKKIVMKRVMGLMDGPMRQKNKK